MPDFDVDFSDERRQEVIDYVCRKYGKDHVSQIITFGTLSAKSVIRDVGRVLDVPYSDVDKIAKMIPFDKVGNKIVQAPNNGGNWYYQTYVLDFYVPTCTTSKTNTGSESGVTINWSCSDSGSGLKSVTLGGTAVGASGSLAGQKATVNLVAVDNAGRTGTYTVQVTSEGGCDTFCANYCCNDYWCGKGACCSSYRCPYECGFVGRCWTKYY